MSNKLPKHQPTMRTKAAERAEAARAAQAAAQRKRRRTVAILGLLAAFGVVAAIVAAVVVTRGDPAEVLPSATARRLGCSSCHTVNGDRSEGPTWQGLYGSEVLLADGSTVVADEEYLRRSILEPAAQVRQGFSPSMPAVEISDADLEAIIDEIRSLSA
jgi:cytochrome c oxidase subunit 2